MTRRTAVVTGVFGQDGWLLAGRLRVAGWRVIGVARPGHPAVAAPPCELRAVDITDKAAVTDLVAALQPDRVFHVAAVHHSSEAAPGLDTALSGAMVAVNFLATTHFIHALLDKAPHGRLIYAASSQMFRPVPGGRAIGADSLRDPPTWYGLTKSWSMEAIGFHREKHGLHGAAAILFNHESPRRPESFLSRKITMGAARIKLGLANSLHLRNIGAQADWSDAEDAVDAMLRMADADTPADFAVGSGRLSSVRDMLDEAFGRLGLDWSAYVTFDNDASGPTLWADGTGIGQALGWAPRSGLRDAIGRMVDADIRMLDDGSGGRPVPAPVPAPVTAVPEVEGLMARAVGFHQAGRLDEAGRVYRAALTIMPDLGDALHLLGVVLWRQEAPLDGARSMRRAIAAVPALEPAYLNLGNLLFTIGDKQGAIDIYGRGLDNAPTSMRLCEMYCAMVQDQAVAQIYKKDLDAAAPLSQACFNRLLAVPGFNNTLYRILSRQIQVCLEIGRSDQAAQCLKRKNRYDFPNLPESAVEIFPVDILRFSDWCGTTDLPVTYWQAPAISASAALTAAVPDYLRRDFDTLPELAEQPVGAVVNAPMEMLQGFFVKDNYESFLVSRRQAVLTVDSRFTIEDNTSYPLVGATPGTTKALFRIPQGIYHNIKIDDPCIVVSSTPNYWHFMIEVLPQLMVREAISSARNIPVVLYDVRSYQYEFFDLIGLPRSQVIDMRQRLGETIPRLHYHFASAVVPSPVSYPIAVRWLRDTLLPRVGPARAGLPKRIFLSRRGSYPKHRIANDTALGERLEQHGFSIVLPETLSVVETIQLIGQADIVVAPVGAGTANQVFLPPGGTWIHLNNPDFFHADSRWNSQMGVQVPLVGSFRNVTGRFVGDPRTFPTRLVDRLEIPIEIDLDEIDRVIGGL
jgi:GDPmannose 4,6-dehydratase